MSWLTPISLTGKYVNLVPLAASHCDDLIEATSDGDLWKLWYTAVPSPETMSAEIERRLSLQSSGSMLPFAVIDTVSLKPVGMTSYTNVDPVSHRLEIGYTWYRQSVQRTPLNTECKLQLLRHAFETLNCVAVEFRTSFFNFPSRRAIERLGAKADGILRNHMLHKDGTMRDTCVYSIIASEWPTVKSHLNFQLERPRISCGRARNTGPALDDAAH